ncbi:hypothetical protein [Streptomyces anulatus]
MDRESPGATTILFRCSAEPGLVVAARAQLKHVDDERPVDKAA